MDSSEDEDDLQALRNAALASVKSKQKPDVEERKEKLTKDGQEDIDDAELLALRQAALSTKRQTLNSTSNWPPPLTHNGSESNSLPINRVEGQGTLSRSDSYTNIPLPKGPPGGRSKNNLIVINTDSDDSLHKTALLKVKENLNQNSSASSTPTRPKDKFSRYESNSENSDTASESDEDDDVARRSKNNVSNSSSSSSSSVSSSSSNESSDEETHDTDQVRVQDSVVSMKSTVPSEKSLDLKNVKDEGSVNCAEKDFNVTKTGDAETFRNDKNGQNHRRVVVSKQFHIKDYIDNYNKSGKSDQECNVDISVVIPGCSGDNNQKEASSARPFSGDSDRRATVHSHAKEKRTDLIKHSNKKDNSPGVKESVSNSKTGNTDLQSKTEPDSVGKGDVAYMQKVAKRKPIEERLRALCKSPSPLASRSPQKRQRSPYKQMSLFDECKHRQISDSPQKTLKSSENTRNSVVDRIYKQTNSSLVQSRSKQSLLRSRSPVPKHRSRSRSFSPRIKNEKFRSRSRTRKSHSNWSEGASREHARGSRTSKDAKRMKKKPESIHKSDVLKSSKISTNYIESCTEDHSNLKGKNSKHPDELHNSGTSRKDSNSKTLDHHHLKKKNMTKNRKRSHSLSSVSSSTSSSSSSTSSSSSSDTDSEEETWRSRKTKRCKEDIVRERKKRQTKEVGRISRSESKVSSNKSVVQDQRKGQKGNLSKDWDTKSTRDSHRGVEERTKKGRYTPRDTDQTLDKRNRLKEKEVDEYDARNYKTSHQDDKNQQDKKIRRKDKSSVGEKINSDSSHSKSGNNKNEKNISRDHHAQPKTKSKVDHYSPREAQGLIEQIPDERKEKLQTKKTISDVSLEKSAEVKTFEKLSTVLKHDTGSGDIKCYEESKTVNPVKMHEQTNSAAEMTEAPKLKSNGTSSCKNDPNHALLSEKQVADSKVKDKYSMISKSGHEHAKKSKKHHNFEKMHSIEDKSEDNQNMEQQKTKGNNSVVAKRDEGHSHRSHKKQSKSKLRSRAKDESKEDRSQDRAMGCKADIQVTLDNSLKHSQQPRSVVSVHDRLGKRRSPDYARDQMVSREIHDEDKLSSLRISVDQSATAEKNLKGASPPKRKKMGDTAEQRRPRSEEEEKRQKELDARIRLIQMKNEAILKRQREIEEDRKRFQTNVFKH